MFRAGIIAFLQESNTFLPDKTTRRHFEEDLLLEGVEIERRLGASHHEIAGFFAGLRAEGIEPVPIFTARALPFGIIQQKDFESLVDQLLRALRKAGPLDGILAAPHGATVAEGYPDADGHWLSLVRQAIGPDHPLIATIDPHANLSPKMVEACNALIPYQTNPHQDQKERGLEASVLLARTLRKEIQPRMAAVNLPMAINIEKQFTATPPCADILRMLGEAGQERGLLSASLVFGFPYADVAEMGSSIIVLGNNGGNQVAEVAQDLAAKVWARREEFEGTFISVEEAISIALKSEPPVCLLDMGDNVGAGSPADGTFLAHALQQHAPERSFVCLYDPHAVVKAQSIGGGKSGVLKLGGHRGTLSGAPLEANCVVQGIYEGLFQEDRNTHGAFTHFDQGLSAVVRTDRGLTVLLNSKRCAPWSLRQIESCGLDPSNFRILAAKGVHAPVAGYREVCRTFIRVNTPGVTCADMRMLPYKHRRTPMFPFERDFAWGPGHNLSFGFSR